MDVLISLVIKEDLRGKGRNIVGHHKTVSA